MSGGCPAAGAKSSSNTTREVKRTFASQNARSSSTAHRSRDVEANRRPACGAGRPARDTSPTARRGRSSAGSGRRSGTGCRRSTRTASAPTRPRAARAGATTSLRITAPRLCGPNSSPTNGVESTSGSERVPVQREHVVALEERVADQLPVGVEHGRALVEEPPVVEAPVGDLRTRDLRARARRRSSCPASLPSRRPPPSRTRIKPEPLGHRDRHEARAHSGRARSNASRASG